LVWVVTAATAGGRLDHFLVSRGTLGTRSQIQQLIRGARVTVDGHRVKAGAVLRVGQEIRVERRLDTPPTIVPEPIPLTVLYEDVALLVIDKPAGLVVHPAPGHWQGTLVNALLHRWRDTDTRMDVTRLGLVHRLDKDTSGVLLIAKDPASLEHLSGQFRRREVSKEYLALVWGRPRQRTGIISGAIARHPVHRQRMALRAHGRAAVTRYEVMEELGNASLLRCIPETGRTHQIRVHLAAAGHPILADRQYGGTRSTTLIRRHALHAAALTVRHPAHGGVLRFRAPLPPDLREALESLRRKNRA
jgi:23S rRNA pseudouridine1911/1915/1917 synthase